MIICKQAFTRMCNLFKDTHLQLALTDTHAKLIYKLTGENNCVSSCSLIRRWIDSKPPVQTLLNADTGGFYLLQMVVAFIEPALSYQCLAAPENC